MFVQTDASPVCFHPVERWARSFRQAASPSISLAWLVLFIASLLGFAGGAGGAVVQLGAQSSQYLSTNTLASFTVPAGTNRLLVVVVSDPNSPTVPSTVSFGGTPLVLGNSASDSAAAVDSIWYLPMGTSASTTGGSIVATTTGTAERFISAVVFSGVDQSTPVDINGPTANVPAGPVLSTSLNVSSAVGNLVYDVIDDYLQAGIAPLAVGPGQTIVSEQSGAIAAGGFSHYATSRENGAPTVTMSWTMTADAILQATMNIRAAVAPAITTNPVDVTVNAGGTAIFTAAASGAPTPTVQWQFSTDGGATFNNVAGATTTTLTIPNALAGQNGTKFRAVFSNSSGTATTTAATMTVNFAPSVTTNPTSQSVSAGSTATFAAAASGNPTPTVQWQVSTDGGATFNNIAGATSTTLSFSTTVGQNGNLFRAVFTNTVGSATTTAATLTVTAGPVITTNPVDVTVNAGGTAVFTAAASGTPTPTVQWQFSTDGGATFNNVAGATTTTLTIPNALAGQNGTKFRAVFTNSSGTATTTAATMTVNFAPSVTTNPTSQSVSAGSTATFAAAASGNPTPTVQWQVSTDGGATFNNIAGATSTTLSFSTTVGQNGNLFRAVFTNTVGSATTTAATLTVTAGPVITTNPVDVTVNAGGTAVFTAAASGTPTPTVQWQFSTDGGATFNNVAGATTTTLTIPNALAGQNGTKFRAVFSNSSGTATTTAATMTVNFAPSVTTNPTSQSVSAGSTATFAAAASGNPTPTVQWQVSTDGGATFNNIAGATSTTLSFSTTVGQNGNLFRAVFTNTVGSATTTAATLTVNFSSVTYNGDLNTGGSPPVDSSMYAPGTTVTVFGNLLGLVKTNSVFAGWNTAADGSGTTYAPGATFIIGSGSVTLFAKWSLVSYTALSSTGNGSITASFNSLDVGCGYRTSQFIPLTGAAASPPAGSAPPGISFPDGLFDFTVMGCNPGAVVNFTIAYPQPLPPGTQYWKYGPTPGGGANSTPHWYVLPAAISGNTVSFSITDGGLGDDVLIPDGGIIDQGGPGVPLPPIPTPTLNEWALALLSLLVVGLGFGALRVRQRGGSRQG